MNPHSADSDNNRIKFTADAPVPIGRQSEPRVLGVVNKLLAASDHEVFELPARDEYGEDGRLRVDGEVYTVQVTGVPQAPAFWRRVATEGSATTTATLEEMSGWLGGAIESKLNTIQSSERSNTIIALDAHGWADQIVDPNVVSALSSSGLSPAQGLGLAGIAIAGAGTSNSTWLPGTLT